MVSYRNAAQTYPLENVLKAVELHWFVAVGYHDGSLRKNNISHTIPKHLQEELMFNLNLSVL